MSSALWKPIYQQSKHLKHFPRTLVGLTGTVCKGVKFPAWSLNFKCFFQNRRKGTTEKLRLNLDVDTFCSSKAKVFTDAEVVGSSWILKAIILEKALREQGGRGKLEAAAAFLPGLDGIQQNSHRSQSDIYLLCCWCEATSAQIIVRISPSRLISTN